MQVIFTVRAANSLEAALLDLHFSIWKKSRLISLTDSGCLGYFLFIKVKLPSVVSGVLSDGLSLKIPLLKKANSCLKLGETWEGARAWSTQEDPAAKVFLNSPFGVFSFCL